MSRSPMHHILVTGGNRGVGLAICRALVRSSKENFIWLCARNVERAKQQVKTSNDDDDDDDAGGHDEWDGRMRLLQLDVTDEDSIKEACNVLKTEGVKLSVLINNAGVALDLPWSKEPITRELCDKTLDINVRGVQRVFHTLLPVLDKGARVINVSSGSGNSNLDKASKEKQDQALADDLQEETIDAMVAEFASEFKQAVDKNEKVACPSPSGWWLQAYGFSKAMVNTLTRIWARDHPALLITCCSPGLVATDMTTAYSGDSKKKTPEEGAETPVWLATTSSEEIQNGRMYGNNHRLLPWVGYDG